jgi:hypothetical protein
MEPVGTRSSPRKEEDKNKEGHRQDKKSFVTSFFSDGILISRGDPFRLLYGSLVKSPMREILPFS